MWSMWAAKYRNVNVPQINKPLFNQKYVSGLCVTAGQAVGRLSSSAPPAASFMFSAHLLPLSLLCVPSPPLPLPLLCLANEKENESMGMLLCASRGVEWKSIRYLKTREPRNNTAETQMNSPFNIGDRDQTGSRGKRGG